MASNLMVIWLNRHSASNWATDLFGRVDNVGIGKMGIATRPMPAVPGQLLA